MSDTGLQKEDIRVAYCDPLGESWTMVPHKDWVIVPSEKERNDDGTLVKDRHGHAIPIAGSQPSVQVNFAQRGILGVFGKMDRPFAERVCSLTAKGFLTHTGHSASGVDVPYVTARGTHHCNHLCPLLKVSAWLRLTGTVRVLYTGALPRLPPRQGQPARD